jgi:hypothetical protein
MVLVFDMGRIQLPVHAPIKFLSTVWNKEKEQKWLEKGCKKLPLFESN